MIDPRELRIGNIVQLVRFRKLYKVLSVSDRDILIESEDDTFYSHPKELKPVFLTIKKLMDFGFYVDVLFEDSNRPVFIKENNGRYFYLNFNTLQPCDAIFDSGFDLIQYKIEYVHQLQNVYHAFMNQELV